MMNNASGFTLIEVLFVIVIVTILAIALIPNLFGPRKSANDATAQSVARNVLTAMAATEMASLVDSTLNCSYADGIVTIAIGSEVATINAPTPVTGVTCSASNFQYNAIITYSGGSSPTQTKSSFK